jgi:hypothetical protein
MSRGDAPLSLGEAVEDDYQWISAQLERVHAQGAETHPRFREAQAPHDVDAMHLLNEEHRALAAEARALVHFAPFGSVDNWCCGGAGNA